MNATESTIRLKRTSQYINLVRRFQVYIDDVHVQDIKDGEEVVIPMEPGHHELYIKIDWVKSKKLELDIEPGEEIQLICGSPVKGAKLFIPFYPIISSFVPKWYLFLKEIEK
ncbi:hypothetical protein [Alkalihalobacterium chitinilyticum]|uniref:Uncharacterized protein n=1 Tax=Alkalihalobacterium chitinilyticum TaxID=2980103 RepID=A0ABT5VCP1_9BACI|nr:hypothetical protein [Alkalihalobacterium chitinilyticum]MDE5413214.1 hypothetical protein [Alkalihalobacterium chitinilyticum]